MVSDEVLIEDQSHYEVSLTAGQAFVAFVLLLLSLAASFAFGLMIGKGQGEDRLVVRKEPAVINEGNIAASRKNDSKLIDLGVGNDDFKAPAATQKTTTDPVAAPAAAITEGAVTPLTDTTAATTSARVVEAPKPVATAPRVEPKPLVVASKPEPKPVAPAVLSSGPAYAQLLVTGDQKTADALAAKAIDRGFMSTYVERAGTTFKVRVKFASEVEARANEPKLRDLSKDVWIVK